MIDQMAFGIVFRHHVAAAFISLSSSDEMSIRPALLRMMIMLRDNRLAEIE